MFYRLLTVIVQPFQIPNNSLSVNVSFNIPARIYESIRAKSGQFEGPLVVQLVAFKTTDETRKCAWPEDASVSLNQCPIRLQKVRAFFFFNSPSLIVI